MMFEEVFEETKGYCEVQQKVHICAFGTRGMSEIAYLEEVLERAETPRHFYELVTIVKRRTGTTSGTVVVSEQ